ncbi:AAA family ATPase [Desulfonatronum parangueonense]
MHRPPNPFTIKELSPSAPFCNREAELESLLRYAVAGASVVLYAPRRFGKTSLVRRVQAKLVQQGGVGLFADFFGVTSSDDVARRLAMAVYRFTSSREKLLQKALRLMRTFRPVFKPDESGVFSVSVEPTGAKLHGLELLEQTMLSLTEVAGALSDRVNLTLDEFQEIGELPDGFQIEALLRTNIQRMPCSFFFVGSRRRMLLDMFVDKNRPFYQSAMLMELKALPERALSPFILERFQEGTVKCDAEAARSILALTKGHPYYTQKLCFLIFERCGEVVLGSDVQDGLNMLIEMEKPLFEAMLQGLAPRQIALLRGLAAEPTEAVFSLPYMQRHELGSTGAVQGALKRLTSLDLVERNEKNGLWSLSDPFFALWLREM